MSSKINYITGYSPCLPPPSVLCGSVVFRRLGLPWSMASSGHFDHHQTYNGYKAVELLDPSFTECLMKEAMLMSRSARFQCQKKLVEQEGWPLSKECSVSEAPTPDGTSVAGSRQREVARWTKFKGPISTGDSEVSDELDGDEVEVINPFVAHSSSSSTNKPPSKEVHSHIIPSTPISFQPVLSSPKPPLPWPIIASPMKPSPIPNSRPSQVLNSHQLQPVARTSQRREDW
ncbi:hypothetical protein O181_054371 [Austropuccinia psidii MF-1]|uniref:Uncharacterized protein n=1 Tax=Austropuccinia psidii MF-1 TaxID=1389203 RepID=A0A9Q3E9C7_9BASI|nr:hypothetical protein [Austropuccinia psidii MF-1]